MSFSYEFYIPDKPMFVILYTGISLFFTALMLFTRRLLLTKIYTFAMMIAFLPTFLFNFGDWALVIPMALSILILFFASGTSEGIKTVLGTVILLVYILSSIAFFVYNSVMTTSGNQVFIERQISPSGLYRYEAYRVTSTVKGGARIYVEPNTLDKDMKYIFFIAKDMEKLVYYNTEGMQCDAEWRSDDIYVTSDSGDKGPWFDAKRDSIFIRKFLVFKLYGYNALTGEKLSMAEVKELSAENQPKVTEPNLSNVTTTVTTAETEPPA